MSRLEKLERMLEADPNDAFVLYGIAQEYAAGGKHERALPFYDRCLNADPNYCYAYYHKARALQSLGRTREAGEVIQAGLIAARRAGDAKALGELEALLDEV